MEDAAGVSGDACVDRPGLPSVEIEVFAEVRTAGRRRKSPAAIRGGGNGRFKVE